MEKQNNNLVSFCYIYHNILKLNYTDHTTVDIDSTVLEWKGIESDTKEVAEYNNVLHEVSGGQNFSE